jgi:hypothetical protein
MVESGDVSVEVKPPVITITAGSTEIFNNHCDNSNQ